ncbi:N-acetylmuramoyl-L-alanine amidase [Aeromicrobium sp. Sec7.5]|uniref:N-acetylmuramoyl-L-alanine amidase n=1 Tax=Aeromicrobium sp. Sec7.5 TaxID=3121276 RepID=UPI002FE4DC77
MRRTRRATLLRFVPLLAVTTLVAALLVAVTFSQLRTEDTAGTPAEVEKSEFDVTPEQDREPYTAEDAALVAVADPTVETIQDGVIVAELAPHDLPGFELLGVTWTDGVPADVAEVQVRWQQDGSWSDWTILDPESQEVEGGIPGTEPKWVGPSQAAQARIIASDDIDPAGLTLVTVASGESPTLTQAAATQPNIISRASWGARAYGGSGCGSAPSNGTFKGTIVHHTAGSNNYSAAQSAGIVRSAQAYHMDGQRWCDIGYNFLIDRYGQTFEGRAGGITKTPYGAHAGNSAVNASTTGVSLMGEFTSAVPPDAMKNALVQLVAWRHSLFGTPAKGRYTNGSVTIHRIDGHRSVKSTACPGQQVFNWINAAGGLRDQVEQAMSADLVRTAASPTVYLVDSGTKYPLSGGVAYNELASALGPARVRPDAEINALANGAVTGSVLRNASTGYIAKIEQGQAHPFPDCATVTLWTGGCGAVTNVSSSLMNRFSVGAPMSAWFGVGTSKSPQIGYFTSGSGAQPLTDLRAAQIAGFPGWAGRLDEQRYATLTKAQASSSYLVRTRDSSVVYLVDAGQRWQLADYTEYVKLASALGPVQISAPSHVSTAQDRGTTAAILRNLATGYIGSIEGGQRHPFPDCATVTLWAGSCGAVTNVSDALMSIVPEGAPMSRWFIVEGGAQWGALESPTSARYYPSQSEATSAGLPAFASTVSGPRAAGISAIATTGLVKSSSSADVYLTDGSSRWILDGMTTYRQLVSAYGSVRTVSAGDLAALPARGTTGAILRNATTGYIALVQDGQLHPFPDCATAALWMGSCGAATNVSSVLMSSLAVGAPMSAWFRVDGATTVGRLTTPSRAVVYPNAGAAPGIPAWVASLSPARYATLGR